MKCTVPSGAICVTPASHGGEVERPVLVAEARPRCALARNGKRRCRSRGRETGARPEIAGAQQRQIERVGLHVGMQPDDGLAVAAEHIVEPGMRDHVAAFARAQASRGDAQARIRPIRSSPSRNATKAPFAALDAEIARQRGIAEIATRSARKLRRRSAPARAAVGSSPRSITATISQARSGAAAIARAALRSAATAMPALAMQIDDRR